MEDQIGEGELLVRPIKADWASGHQETICKPDPVYVIELIVKK